MATNSGARQVVRLVDVELDKARRRLGHASHVHHTALPANKEAARAALEDAAIAFTFALVKSAVR